MSEPIPFKGDMDEKRKLGLNWQTAAISAFLIWAGWVSAALVLDGVAIAECRQWRVQRPQFVTTSEQDLALLRKEKELRDLFSTKIDSALVEFRQNQATLIQRLTDIDKKLAEHIAVK